jgi:hypothetical protein
MVIGMPIAFAFLAVNISAHISSGAASQASTRWSGGDGSGREFLHHASAAVSLMGEVLFRAGLAARLMDVLDAPLGRYRAGSA